MAKKGINIKQLSKELGMTSRQLIDRCREAGMAVQNSITKLSKQDEQRVRGWFEPGADAAAGAERDARS